MKDPKPKNSVSTSGGSGQPAHKYPPAPSDACRYWLIAPGEGAFLWDECRREGIMSIGWDGTGDRTPFQSQAEFEEAHTKAFPEASPGRNSAVGKMLFDFGRNVRPGDAVFAKKGRSEVLGWGIVTGPCQYDPGREEHHHFLPVRWHSFKVAPSPKPLPTKTVTNKTHDPDFSELVRTNYGQWTADSYTFEMALAELFVGEADLHAIVKLLEHKKNIILQGAPGVGKTFIARRLAHLVLGSKDDTSVEMVQFHQSSSYEDFVEGIKPDPESGGFQIRKGLFHRFCERARSEPEKPYFLIIDEINRGNLSKILGELMMLIEPDKRGQSLVLGYSGESFSVPPNVHLIGAMNTADRSLSMVDYALRRRFAFITMEPGFHHASFAAHLGKYGVGQADIAALRHAMAALNMFIMDDVDLGSGYRIGHSFFTPNETVEDFRSWYGDRVHYEILPLLDEYWVDDPDKIAAARKLLALTV